MRKILISRGSAGFRFSDEFVLHVFKRYQPHTAIGNKLFASCGKTVIKDGKKFIVTFVDEYEVISEDGFVGDYKFVTHEKIYDTHKSTITYVENTCTKDLYFLQKRMLSWRSIPEVISMVEEYGIDRASDEYSKLSIAQIPDDYNYKVAEYDGIERVKTVIPYLEIIQNLLDKLNDKDSHMHELTKKLLTGKSLKDIVDDSKVIYNDSLY